MTNRKRAMTGQGTHGDDLPAVAPDHNARLGSSGASLAVPSGSTAESAVAPTSGYVICTLPDLLTVRVRIAENAVADANDQSYIGADTWHWPIQAGERVSLFGDASSGTVTISMAK